MQCILLNVKTKLAQHRTKQNIRNFNLTIVLLPSCKLYFQEITLCLLQITLFLYYLHFQLLLDLVNFVTSIMLVSFYYFAGHAMWPAVVLDESLASNCKGLKMFLGGRSVPVQFFGTHDFARFDILWKLRKILVWMFSGRLFSLYCKILSSFLRCTSLLYILPVFQG